MSIVTVKNKYQVVIPRALRERAGVNIGDLLEAKVERGKITFTPKSLVDRGVAQSLEDFKRGRAHGPFSTHEELLQALHAGVKKAKAAKTKSK